MQPITTVEQFNEIITTQPSVIVKFYAGWCPDCTRMNMFIDPIIEQYNQYTWYEVNRDELPELAEKYEVMGIPTLAVFKNGEKVGHTYTAQTQNLQNK